MLGQTTPIVITRNGKPVAVLTPLDESDLDSIKLSANLKFITMLERSYRSFQKKGEMAHGEQLTTYP